MNALIRRKAEEPKIFLALYKNVELLSHLHPMSEALKNLFRSDMFTANSKPAFFHTGYYLLEALDPDIIKQKITCWPILEVKDEQLFRKEFLNYVKELNSIYVYANIPVCQPSTLISPAGINYGKFMLKLSQFVLHKYLQKTDSEQILLYPNNSKAMNPKLEPLRERSLKKCINKIESDTILMISDFKELQLKKEEQLKKGEIELKHLQESIKVSEQELTKSQKQFDLKQSTSKPEKSLDQRYEDIKLQLQKIYAISNLFDNCTSLLKENNRDDLVLKHNETELNVPSSVEHIINKKQLNLIDFFQGLIILLNEKVFQFPNLTNTWIEQTKTNLEKLINDYQNGLNMLHHEKHRLNKHNL